MPNPDFPVLEVMTPGTGHPVGTRFPLFPRPFIIGRAKDNPLPLASGLVSRRHCELVFEFDRWWLRDLGTTHGTFHLGERIHDTELLHADCFEVARVASFRLLLHQPVEVREPEMERAIVERPDDDERWAVYADWLQEHGSPLGERIANPSPADDRRWLGPLAGFAGRGELQVHWEHGLPSGVVLRRLSANHPEVDWAQRLALLLAQPEFRFVRSLEVDVGSFHRESSHSRWGTELLEVLGLDALPMLERLAIRPAAIPPDVLVLDAALAARRARQPRFQTTAQTLFSDWGPATLTVESAATATRTVTLDRGPLFNAGSPPLSLGADCPGFSLVFVDTRWLLAMPEVAHAELRVNGVACTRSLLRPGDVIEPMPGIWLRFEA